MPAPALLALQQATRAHQRAHGCNAHTFEDGEGLWQLVAAHQPRRVLELGTGLGYTACLMALASSEAVVDTLEGDAIHAELARDQIAQLGLQQRVRLHEGSFSVTLPALQLQAGSLDLVFFDGNMPAFVLVQRFHSLLAPGGLLVATFMGPGMSWRIAGEPFDEHRVGMNVLAPGASWDDGGPMVLHAPWWLRTHWGRLFDVVRLQEHGFCAAPGDGHGVITLRRREVSLTAADLERPDPDDPREATALARQCPAPSR